MYYRAGHGQIAKLHDRLTGILVALRFIWRLQTLRIPVRHNIHHARGTPHSRNLTDADPRFAEVCQILCGRFQSVIASRAVIVARLAMEFVVARRGQGDHGRRLSARDRVRLETLMVLLRVWLAS